MKRLTLAFALLAGLVARATTWYIAPEGKDDGTYDGKSWTQPFATLSNAVAKIANKDAIIVSNGVYKFDKGVAIDKYSVTLRSLTRDPKDVIFDGQHKTRLVSFSQYGASVTGITFQNAYRDNSAAGGVEGIGLYIYGSGSFVSNCVFRGNYGRGSSNSLGGGLYQKSYADWPGRAYDILCESNALDLVSGTPTGELYVRGGGAFFDNVVVTNSVFRYNSVTNSRTGYYHLCAGGGAFLSASTLTDCEVYGNDACNACKTGCGVGAACAACPEKSSTASSTATRRGIVAAAFKPTAAV